MMLLAGFNLSTGIGLKVFLTDKILSSIQRILCHHTLALAEIASI